MLLEPLLLFLGHHCPVDQVRRYRHLRQPLEAEPVEAVFVLVVQLDDDDVLDADPELSFLVVARLDRSDVTCCEWYRRWRNALCDRGRGLVDATVASDAVSCPVVAVVQP